MTSEFRNDAQQADAEDYDEVSGTCGLSSISAPFRYDMNGRGLSRLLNFEPAVLSAQGPRARNEDACHATAALLLVADGVGGRPGGRAAADLATKTLRGCLAAGPVEIESDLVDAVKQAHRVIVEHSRRNSELAGMACTLDAVMFTPSGALIGAHVGDSRVYRVPAGGTVEQLTLDEAHNGMLLQSLGGTAQQVRPRIWCRSSTPGDRLVLATDGLWNALSDRAVAALITGTCQLTPADAAHVLVITALEAGAHDNVSVVVADVAGQSIPLSGAEHQTGS